MVITCQQCGQYMEAPNSAVGKRVKCPSCGHLFRAALPWATVLDDDMPVGGTATDDQPAAAPPAAEEPAAPAEPAEEPAPPPADEPPAAPAEEEYAEAEILDDGGDAIPEGIPLSPDGTPVTKGDVLTLAQAGPAAPAPPEEVQWYAATGEGQIGPMTSRQIVLAAREGKITRETMLKNTGTGATRRAGDVPGLFAEEKKPRREKKPGARKPAREDMLGALATASGGGASEDAPEEAPADAAPADADALAALAAAAKAGTGAPKTPRHAAAPEAKPEAPPTFGRYLLVGLWRDWGISLIFPLKVLQTHRRLGGTKIYRPLSLLGAWMVLLLAITFLGLPRGMKSLGLLDSLDAGAIVKLVGLYACGFTCGMLPPVLLSVLYRLFGAKNWAPAFHRAFTNFYFSYGGLYLVTAAFFLWAMIRGRWMSGASFESLKAPGVVFGVFGLLYSLYALAMIVCGSRGLNNWSWGRSIGVTALWLFVGMVLSAGLALGGALLLGLALVG